MQITTGGTMLLRVPTARNDSNYLFRSDTRIQELLQMPNRVMNPGAHNVADANHDRRDYVIESADGTERFKLFVQIGNSHPGAVANAEPGNESRRAQRGGCKSRPAGLCY